MEYDNCGPTEPTLFGLSSTTIGAIILILVLLLIIYFARPKGEHYGDRVDEIMTALDVTMKEKGTIVDFKRAIREPSFSPVKYIHLADLHRQGKITKEAVAKILEDKSL